MNLVINYWAVLVSAIAMFVVGFLWYGPIFGKKWLALSNVTPEMIEKSKGKSMKVQYALTFVGSLLMAGTFAHVLGYASGFMQQSGAMLGMQAAFWLWLGFVAPVTLYRVLWEGKRWSLWILDNAYYLVSLLVMGIILASWVA